jgi:hypothetical protein
VGNRRIAQPSERTRAHRLSRASVQLNWPRSHHGCTNGFAAGGRAGHGNPEARPSTSFHRGTEELPSPRRGAHPGIHHDLGPRLCIALVAGPPLRGGHRSRITHDAQLTVPGTWPGDEAARSSPGSSTLGRVVAPPAWARAT